jgi:hypothetical protein
MAVIYSQLMLAVSKCFLCCFPWFLGFRVRYSRYKSAAERAHQQYGCYLTFFMSDEDNQRYFMGSDYVFFHLSFIKYTITWDRHDSFLIWLVDVYQGRNWGYPCGWKQKSQIACCLWSHKNFKPGNVRCSVCEVLGSGGHRFDCHHIALISVHWRGQLNWGEKLISV